MWSVKFFASSYVIGYKPPRKLHNDTIPTNFYNEFKPCISFIIFQVLLEISINFVIPTLNLNFQIVISLIKNLSLYFIWFSLIGTILSSGWIWKARSEMKKQFVECWITSITNTVSNKKSDSTFNQADLFDFIPQRENQVKHIAMYQYEDSQNLVTLLNLLSKACRV